MNEWSNAKLCDVANLILGAILLASPWIFGFPSGAASQTAVICGIVIVAISIAALAAFTVWEEWLNLIVGAWVLVSPWVLGFAGTTAVSTSSLASSLPFLPRWKSGFFISARRDTLRPADCARRSHNGRGVCFLLADAAPVAHMPRVPADV